MENSTADNAQSPGLSRLHEIVTRVKADREVGIAYMKVAEVEKRIREEGREEGRAEVIIESGYEFGLSEEDILGRLQKKLSISLEVAKMYIVKFKKQQV